MAERDYVVVNEGAKPTLADGWREVTLGDLIEIKPRIRFQRRLHP